METNSTASRPRHRRLDFRPSVRGLIVLVLVAGGGLGWVLHRADARRKAVEIIRGVEGRADYEGHYDDGYYYFGTGGWWPSWLEGLVGVDLIGNVTGVQLGGGQSAPEATLAAVAELDRLESLALFRMEGLTDDGLAHLRGNGRLKQLMIHDSPRITGAGLVHLEGLARLEQLSLPTIHATDADLAHLAGLTRLEHLSLSFDASSTVCNDGLAALSGMRRLESLQLRGARATNLAALAPLSGLNDLGLYDLPVDDLGLAPLAGFGSLKVLRLVNLPRLTDAGLAHLRALADLEDLAVARCPVGDAGVASLLGCRKLESINISGTLVGDDGLLMLAGLPKLGFIVVSGTRVTPEGIKAARALRPGLAIQDP